MAFVICEQHGGHGAPLLCEHLREAVRRRPGATCGFALDRRRAWMGNVLITAGAEEDYAESLRWYAERSKLAAEGFEAEFARALEAIAENPDRYPMCDDRHHFYLGLADYLS